jgi:hypothetical protein
MKIVQQFIDIITASPLSDEADRFINEFIQVTSVYDSAFKDLPQGCTLRGEVYLQWDVSQALIKELAGIVQTMQTSDNYIGTLHEPDRFSPYYWFMIREDGGMIKIIINTCMIPLFIYTGQEYQELNR